MDTSLFLPALLTAIFCYLGAIESSLLLGMTGGFYIVGRPLVAGLLVGLAFGDVQAGVLCGLAVQGVFIANLSTGGATNSEITYASYGGIGLALATTKDPAIAVTLSVLIGQTFGLIFYNTRMALYSFWNNRAQKAAEDLDDRGIVLNHFILPQITTFLIRAVPIFLAIYFGRDLVDALLKSVPEIVTHIISVLGGVLPALGIAMLMAIVIKEKLHLIFFFAGFVLLAFADLSMIALVFIAALVAYLVYLSSQNTAQSAKAAASSGTSVTVNDKSSSASSSQPVVDDEDDWFEDEDLF
ncbi:PTS mannose/fructose/sorbose/N-acetylgalactosamine transporter subunit IIC [Aerococcus sanguinicola]|uniref:PTS mannose/fructose/sorbose/N-acetylgalactosamine transporter subunit IIC n=2 Tax=Bacillati TaxID=1783272 RepID=UPI0008A4C1C3|nr:MULTISPECIES: PTS sugar transporter subunit IIC [unclassified Aerococcus]KAB0647356.1 PTS sugar transporter subunit IIC [Aerococcus sanguinicola]MDK6233180.1 PTS sugar transporter subunit IIC [Aerococcus sp. UMB10185]MDK6856017.1 PTS sugar transporter subunit IIC [Aerococcus sp. UMB7533]MDK8502388.1 PTS sugar transporter subunit IIC [Aerococcus sp. UMB1112A]OFN00303.1 PTS sugar transporter subunit IIC [Aerococcus sp. HMSC062A02]